jgi:hypothetical protein
MILGYSFSSYASLEVILGPIWYPSAPSNLAELRISVSGSPPKYTAAPGAMLEEQRTSEQAINSVKCS